MRRWILDIICCPICKGKLMLTEIESNEADIAEGLLTCAACKAVYPIFSGIANLLPPDRELS
ncbi:MAG: methytransferase partner Trm112 [Methanocalculaceae archaeon]|jgi:uncharacterized protein YbaR (Trm112 family)|nr:methytransferase partner Trm112 [Methanocalculaceae archaeon]